MSWNKVLEDYARLKRPEREMPPGVFVAANRKTTTIFDGFEKAKFHLLILPREPFELDNGTTLSGTPLASLSQLLKSPHALQVLKVLQNQAEDVKEMIRDEMEKEYGWSWGVQAGFHAVESMRHVHLHVISTDFISPKLKNKKHWNSFHPTLGYFLHLSDVIAAVESGNNPLQADTKHYETLLKTELVSTYPPHATFATIPKLKEHLEVEWERQGRQRRRSREEAESEKRP
ncbi:hypothetical protein JCM10908_000149 [Rhodotorula pacifica]|uniref:DNA 5'-adenosine monophosphate hydrolase n=1 Tax=Rhodotorula pacifica TaxID=1495444 RepID=UPI0031767315